MPELQRITVTFTMVTRNDPVIVLDGVRERLAPLRSLIVDSKVTIGEALPAEVEVPAEVVDEAVDYLEEWAHENCDSEGCPGNTRPYSEATAKGLLARALPTYRALLLAKTEDASLSEAPENETAAAAEATATTAQTPNP